MEIVIESTQYGMPARSSRLQTSSTWLSGRSMKGPASPSVETISRSPVEVSVMFSHRCGQPRFDASHRKPAFIFPRSCSPGNAESSPLPMGSGDSGDIDLASFPSLRFRIVITGAYKADDVMDATARLKGGHFPPPGAGVIMCRR